MCITYVYLDATFIFKHSQTQIHFASSFPNFPYQVAVNRGKGFMDRGK